MAVKISGKQILWGIPTTSKADADAIVTGIVQEFKVALGGNTAEINDEDGDIVTRVDHGAKNTISVQTIVEGTLGDNATLPEKGDEVTLTTDEITGGLAFVDSAEVTYKGNDSTGVSITITHYPVMAAPGP